MKDQVHSREERSWQGNSEKNNEVYRQRNGWENKGFRITFKWQNMLSHQAPNSLVSLNIPFTGGS